MHYFVHISLRLENDEASPCEPLLPDLYRSVMLCHTTLDCISAIHVLSHRRVDQLKVKRYLSFAVTSSLGRHVLEHFPASYLLPVEFLTDAVIVEKVFHQGAFGLELAQSLHNFEVVGDVECRADVFYIVNVIFFLKVCLNLLLHALRTVVVELNVPTDDSEVRLRIRLLIELDVHAYKVAPDYRETSQKHEATDCHQESDHVH